MKNFNYIKNFGLFTSLFILIQGCSPTKKLSEGNYLLKSNNIVINGKKDVQEKQKLKESLKAIALQKTNTKTIGFLPLKLWLYTAANTKKENKFNWWIKNKVGEAPVVYDSILANKTDKSMLNYMQNAGFFNAKVSHTVDYKKRKATVTYTIEPAQVWTIGRVLYPRPTYPTDSLVWQNHNKSNLKTGEPFNVLKLKSERDRIELDLQNSGFYFFTKDYVTYDLDTTVKFGEVNINVIINQLNDSTRHKQYYINEIYANTDFGSDLLNIKNKKDTTYSKGVHILNKKKNIRTKILLDGIFTERSQLFNKEKHLLTISRLSDYGVFKFVSQEYEKVDSAPNKLNTIINLTPAKRQTIGMEGQLNYMTDGVFGGLFGVSGGISYKNKNLTKNADLLTVDLNTGIQFQVARNQPTSIITTQFGADISYYYNKLLLFKKNPSHRFKSPKTKFRINYNFEERFDFTVDYKRAFLYDLHNFGLSMGYEWKQSNAIRHSVIPINFSFFLFPKKGQEFINRLNANESLKNTFQERILFGPSYTLDFTSQKTLNDKKHISNRFNIETSGNLLMAGFALASLEKKNKPPFKIADREFAQFTRVENEVKGFYRFHPNFSFAGRTFLGIAVPYGNSSTVPFVRQFFTGGPNSLRGFRVREIGPGAYAEEDFASGERRFGFFNQTGDIRIELNAELRIDIYKWIKAAFFLDCGNVWLLNVDEKRPKANFEFNRFWNEFAMNWGAGLRFDFSYFVIRFDYGVPMRDPRISAPNKFTIRPGQFQLGVGYPF